MICPECDGKGRQWLRPEETDFGFDMIVPCPCCGGCGIVHCCEGDVADPEMEDERVRPAT